MVEVKVAVDVAGLFLTPASILIGALGVARTEGLKTGVSALGIVSSVLWYLAYDPNPLYDPAVWSSPIYLLPIFFGIAWVIALGFHGLKFCAELCTADSLDVRLKRLHQELQHLSEDDIRSILRAHAALKTTLK